MGTHLKETSSHPGSGGAETSHDEKFSRLTDEEGELRVKMLTTESSGFHVSPDLKATRADTPKSECCFVAMLLFPWPREIQQLDQGSFFFFF